MPWQRATFKDGSVWAEVSSAETLTVSEGRVKIRYSRGPKSKVYRAAEKRVQLNPGASVEELDEGITAEPQKKTSEASNSFGRAGTRSNEQTALARAEAENLIASLTSRSVLCFTDGGCKGNPGPAGAGAVVVLPNGRRAEASRALGTATNNIAELTAIKIALELLGEAKLQPDTPITLLTDSSYAIGVLARGWKAKANKPLIQEILSLLSQWPTLKLQWVAGHAGIEGNERADELANLGIENVTQTQWTKA